MLPFLRTKVCITLSHSLNEGKIISLKSMYENVISGERKVERDNGIEVCDYGTLLCDISCVCNYPVAGILY